MPFLQLLLAQQVPLVSLGAAGLFSQPSGTLETAHAVPKGDFCLQGQFWCHWSPGEKGGLAVTGWGCSSWGTHILPPRQALSLDSLAGTCQALEGPWLCREQNI